MSSRATQPDTWDDIKEGDRVRLTGHGEVHEFTVRDAHNYGIAGEQSFFYRSDGWTVEILQSPLPEKNGLYVTEGWDGLEYGLWERDAGEWYEMYCSEWMRRPESDVPRDLTPLAKGTRA